MAPPVKTPQSNTVIPFKPRPRPVQLTDRRRRLPAISSTEVEIIFDHLARARNNLGLAA